MSKAILVTGATGKQGGAVVKQLLAANADITILAVTRNASSPSAQKLAQMSPNIKLVEGNLNDPAALFRNAREAAPQGIWGIFSVQVFAGGGQSVESEERQGKALVDEALEQGLKFFVYSSVDRGGDKSLENPTDIPHFISKHHIEQHLLEKTSGSEMDWTILRPVAFFDNMVPGFLGKVFASMWRSLGSKPLQFIAVADIGHFAAQAFLKPEEYKGKAISLAGDELTFEQGNIIFKEKLAYDMPTTFGFIVSFICWAVKEVGTMVRWFKQDGYAVDIQQLRQIHPGLLDFAGYLEKESAYVRRGEK